MRIAARTRSRASRTAVSGKPTMEVMTKKGEKIEKYKANGSIGSGDGEKAGVAYRMKDGSMVYVPEAAEGGAQKPDAKKRG